MSLLRVVKLVEQEAGSQRPADADGNVDDRRTAPKTRASVKTSNRYMGFSFSSSLWPGSAKALEIVLPHCYACLTGAVIVLEHFVAQGGL
jgi:hypothetical protein